MRGSGVQFPPAAPMKILRNQWCIGNTNKSTHGTSRRDGTGYGTGSQVLPTKDADRLMASPATPWPLPYDADYGWSVHSACDRDFRFQRQRRCAEVAVTELLDLALK